MPLPWKKSRVTRISRLVADLQSSPRRGGSLVVETGFPTSLIDLFVKNRDRLRKPSRRKAAAEEDEEEEEPPELQISHPVLTSPLPAHLVVRGPDPLHDPPPPAAPAAPPAAAAAGSRAVDDGAVDGADGDYVGGGSGKSNSVFSAVFKVFVVVVLALSTKGLVIGVMMSAFLLLFLEFVGKRVVGFLRPCPDARMGFEGSIGRACAILSSVWPQRGLLVRPAVTNSDPAEPSRDAGGGPGTRVVEYKFERVAVPVENDSSFGPDGDERLGRDPRWRCVYAEGEVRVVEEVEEDGRGALGADARKQNRKIKSKIIKRMVPKKLRTSKKGKKKECESNPDASNTLAVFLGDFGTAAAREGEGEAQEEYGEQGGNADKSCSSKAGVEEFQQRARCSNKGADRLLAAETNLTLATTSQARPELETGAGNARSENKRKLGLVVVLLVVLAGLIGGRFLAFVLTFGCAVTISIWARRRSFRSAKDRS
ncbi:hypothetical protein EUGRSUZ_D00100 [Eucalyptus grandis]|uniref:Uncharacterized protein n=2 Tax=Eucalyptus grandis TaxID=71139 RepID=A0ACC3L1U1_EUCGR|nr:hypothetical protein EUGRSUZ_D00100 [Eucalyptus grandis]